jgi:hypothetical protein
LVADTEVGQMKGIFKRISAGATGTAGEKTRKPRKPAVRRRYIVRG